MGLPLEVSVPRFKSVPWRYCTGWDEKPAAQLGKSLLLLGICRPSDWDGSAVDFVERGFQRFCLEQGAAEAARVWQGELRLTDCEFEMNEWEREQSVADREHPIEALFLVGEYTAAASLPIGPAWSFLQSEHPFLPAAVYRVLADNLGKWMRLYECRDAMYHAEAWMEGMAEEELKDSLYPKVKNNIPQCLRRLEEVSYTEALKFLARAARRLQGPPAQLVSSLLEMHKHGKAHEPAWPSTLAQTAPEIEAFMNDSDGCGPGCLICWHEGDEISACFDEEMSTLGQNGPLEPSFLLQLRLNLRGRSLDGEVQRVFDHAAALLRSLAAGARAVETIREMSDESNREHRLQPEFSPQPRAAGLRQEQL